MNAKTTIRKILFIAIWLCIGGGMFVLLMAAINKKNKGQCKDYSITIKGAEHNLFIDKKDVEQLMMKSTNGKIKGVQVSSFNLSSLEQMLENSTWISNAELYFDNQDVLHVTVTEREPVARVFTIENNSFYIDSTGRKMPLSDKLSARVPVFTSFPERKLLSSRDSVLLNDIRIVANYINKESFWMSQVAQIDITADRNFEMVPLVGNHIVRLGNAENIDQKFRRLMIFYQQILCKTGFDKYKLIDVQYKGQIVTSRFAGDPKIDSVQLRKNVEKLLRESIEAQNDTVIRTMAVKEHYAIDSNEANIPSGINESHQPEQPNPNPGLSNRTPVIRQTVNDRQADNKMPAKTTNVTADKNRQPKAVMPKKTKEGETNAGYN